MYKASKPPPYDPMCPPDLPSPSLANATLCPPKCNSVSPLMFPSLTPLTLTFRSLLKPICSNSQKITKNAQSVHHPLSQILPKNATLCSQKMQLCVPPKCNSVFPSLTPLTLNSQNPYALIVNKLQKMYKACIWPPPCDPISYPPHPHIAISRSSQGHLSHLKVISRSSTNTHMLERSKND